MGAKRKTKRRRKSKKELLKQRAWEVFSRWTRSKDADFAGYVKCVTCGKVKVWNSGEIHAGHYIHGRLDYDEMNIHPQCRDCNYGFAKTDVHAKYSLYMHKRYGYDAVQELIKRSFQKKNDYSIEELEDIVKKYGSDRN